MPASVASALDLGIGTILTLLVGWSLLRPLGSRSGRLAAFSPTGLSLALVFGITLLVGIGFPLARLGAPVTPGAITVLAILLTAAFLFLRFRRPRLPFLGLEEEAPGDGMSRLAGLLVIAGLALFLVKIGFAPLWTWDHFAVWGVKSRRMVVDGALDLGFLDLGIFRRSEAHYPLGLPFAWRLLALGAVPGDLAFKVCHALFGLALVAVTRQGLLLASGSRRIANGLTAWLAVSPVLWDTIGLGHADLPMALWAITALVLVLAAIGTPDRAGRQGETELGTAFPLGLAGVAAGFLPWIKQEGLLLALALLAASALLLWRSRLSNRPRRLLELGLPAGVTLAASRLAANVARSHGVNFFAGSWWVRAAIRVPHFQVILRAAAGELFATDWLGIWIAFFLTAAICLFARVRRRPGTGTAAVLCGLVGALLAVYVAVYFVTVLPPMEHLHGSFFRILSPLTPLALVAVAALLESVARPGPPSADTRAVRLGAGGGLWARGARAALGLGGSLVGAPRLDHGRGGAVGSLRSQGGVGESEALPFDADDHGERRGAASAARQAGGGEGGEPRFELGERLGSLHEAEAGGHGHRLHTGLGSGLQGEEGLAEPAVEERIRKGEEGGDREERLVERIAEAARVGSPPRP
jgi:hypothetical protein